MYGKNLTLEQRQTIERLYAEDVSVYRIAEAIGVTAATVYRDLKRGATGELDNNLNPAYSAELAQMRARKSLRRRGRRKSSGADKSTEVRGIL